MSYIKRVHFRVTSQGQGGGLVTLNNNIDGIKFDETGMPQDNALQTNPKVSKSMDEKNGPTKALPEGLLESPSFDDIGFPFSGKPIKKIMIDLKETTK